MQILRALKKSHPDSATFLITGHTSRKTGAEAANQGAFARHVKSSDMVAQTTFTTRHSATGRGEYMAFLDMDVSKYLGRGNPMRVYPLQEPPHGENMVLFPAATPFRIE